MCVSYYEHQETAAKVTSAPGRANAEEVPFVSPSSSALVTFKTAVRPPIQAGLPNPVNLANAMASSSPSLLATAQATGALAPPAPTPGPPAAHTTAPTPTAATAQATGALAPPAPTPGPSAAHATAPTPTAAAAAAMPPPTPTAAAAAAMSASLALDPAMTHVNRPLAPPPHKHKEDDDENESVVAPPVPPMLRPPFTKSTMCLLVFTVMLVMFICFFCHGYVHDGNHGLVFRGTADGDTAATGADTDANIELDFKPMDAIPAELAVPISKSSSSKVWSLTERQAGGTFIGVTGIIVYDMEFGNPFTHAFNGAMATAAYTFNGATATAARCWAAWRAR